MASWEIEVNLGHVPEQGRREVKQAEEDGGDGQKRNETIAEAWPAAAFLSSPCAVRKFGRWLKQGDGTYRYGFTSQTPEGYNLDLLLCESPSSTGFDLCAKMSSHAMNI